MVKRGGMIAWNIKIYEGNGWMPLQPYLQKQCLQEYQKPVGMLACRVSLPACIFLDAVLRNFRSVWYVTFIRCPLMVGWAWQSAFATVPRLHLSLRCLSSRSGPRFQWDSIRWVRKLRLASENSHTKTYAKDIDGACMHTLWKTTPRGYMLVLTQKTMVAHADMHRSMHLRGKKKHTSDRSGVIP